MIYYMIYYDKRYMKRYGYYSEHHRMYAFPGFLPQEKTGYHGEVRQSLGRWIWTKAHYIGV